MPKAELIEGIAGDCLIASPRGLLAGSSLTLIGNRRHSAKNGCKPLIFHILENGTYACAMQLNPQDLIVALKLALQPGLTFQKLADSLGLSVSAVHRSVTRAKASGLLLADRQPNRPAILEFLLHGVRYAFPPVRGTMTRGMPTAHAAPPLAALIVQDNDPVPVWPDPQGETRGVSLKPLCRSAPQAARADAKLYECLSLIDAIRAGRARERNLAKEHLTRLLNG